jgi:hypothetical protein
MAWFFTPNEEEKTLIHTMVADLTKQIAPDLTVNRPEVLSVNKTTRLIEKLMKTFKEYDGNKKLGYLARVRFLHHMRWALIDSGYSKEFVAVVIESLLSGVVAARPQADKKS